MANINVVVDRPIADGYKLKFRTPCDSTTIEGLEVKYPAKNGVGTLIKKFVFKDAHGTELSGVGNLFVSGVMIEVLLDVTHSVAYIQNADTNSYVESVKSEVQRLEESQRQFLGVAGKAVEECERVTAETAGAIEATKEATNTLVLTHEEFVSGGYVEALKELNSGNKFSVWIGTTDEYNALPQKVNNCFYILTDDASRNDILVQIGALESELSLLNGNVGDLVTDVESTKDNVTNLQSDLDIANTNISELLSCYEAANEQIINMGGQFETVDEQLTGLTNRVGNTASTYFKHLFGGEILSSSFDNDSVVAVDSLSDYKLLSFTIVLRDSGQNKIVAYCSSHPTLKYDYANGTGQGRIDVAYNCFENSGVGVNCFRLTYDGNNITGMQYDASTLPLGDTIIINHIVGIM